MTPHIYPGLYPHMAKGYLGKIPPKPRTEPAVNEKIIKIVCDFFSVNLEDLKSRSRKRPITEARQVVMYFLCKETRMFLKNIGKELGGRNHSTVIYGKDTVIDIMATNKVFKAKINNIAELIKS